MVVWKKLCNNNFLTDVWLLQHFLQLRKISRAACCAGLLWVFLLNIFCRYKRLFRTPTIFSVTVQIVKNGAHLFGPLQTVCGFTIYGAFKLRCFPDRTYGSTSKNNHFLGLLRETKMKPNTPLVCETQRLSQRTWGIWTTEDIFDAPIWLPPKRLVDEKLHSEILQYGCYIFGSTSCVANFRSLLKTNEKCY